MLDDLMPDDDGKLMLVAIEAATVAMKCLRKEMEKSIYSWQDFWRDFLCR
jgi:hypothetical protein